MTPLDDLNQGMSCPSFTTDVILDNGQAHNAPIAVGTSTSTVTFNIEPTHYNEVRTFSYAATVASDSYIMTNTFEVTICRIPDTQAASVTMANESS